MPDHATSGRADKAVVTGDMARDATDGRTFKTALRVGRSAHQSDCKRQSGAAEKSLHWQNSIAAISIHGDDIRSRLAMMENTRRGRPHYARTQLRCREPFLLLMSLMQSRRWFSIGTSRAIHCIQN
jgi:hypothetical protein